MTPGPASAGGAATIIPVMVVTPPRTLLLDVAGPVEVLRAANAAQTDVRFEVAYVGPSARVSSSIGLELAGIAPLPEDLPDGAVVAVSGSASSVLGRAATAEDAADDDEDDAAIVAWLRRVVGPGHTLVSICSGALLAGRAGLLDGRDCTTHHDLCAELARVAPRARVLDNRLFVEDGKRLTSAGVTAGIDLMLHLVAQRVSPAAAQAAARHLVVFARRAGADPQISPWLEGRNHVHPAVHRAQDAIAADPARPWSLEDLAAAAHASPRHLSRLFNEHAGMSVTAYANTLRLALARQLISNGRLDMESVAERAGFGSTRQLRRAWRRVHPGPPSAARAAAGSRG